LASKLAFWRFAFGDQGVFVPASSTKNIIYARLWRHSFSKLSLTAKLRQARMDISQQESK